MCQYFLSEALLGWKQSQWLTSEGQPWKSPEPTPTPGELLFLLQVRGALGTKMHLTQQNRNGPKVKSFTISRHGCQISTCTFLRVKAEKSPRKDTKQWGTNSAREASEHQTTAWVQPTHIASSCSFPSATGLLTALGNRLIGQIDLTLAWFGNP